MILKLLARLTGRRKRRPPPNAQPPEPPTPPPAAPAALAPAPKPIPEWQVVLTAPIERFCEAPSDDAVRHAWDLYAEAAWAPFTEREARMASAVAEIGAGIAGLKAHVPHLIERALTRHPRDFRQLLHLEQGLPK